MTVQEGGCMCGAVRFRAEGEPVRVGICHCTTCRRNSGAGYSATVVFLRDKVTIEGRAASYASSEQGRRCFCPTCGSPVYSTWGRSEEIDLSLGAFDDPRAFAPTYELWTSERVPWLPAMPDLEHFERDREG